MSRLGRTNFGYSVMGKLGKKKKKKKDFFFLVSLFFFGFPSSQKASPSSALSKIVCPSSTSYEEGGGGEVEQHSQNPPPTKKGPRHIQSWIMLMTRESKKFFFVGVSSGSPRRISVCPLRVYLSIYTRERAISVWFFFSSFFPPPLVCVCLEP